MIKNTIWVEGLLRNFLMKPPPQNVSWVNCEFNDPSFPLEFPMLLLTIKEYEFTF
jgi:hypothetical protein